MLFFTDRRRVDQTVQNQPIQQAGWLVVRVGPAVLKDTAHGQLWLGRDPGESLSHARFSRLQGFSVGEFTEFNVDDETLVP